MSWEENQHDRNKTNLECGAKMTPAVVKLPQLGKTKFLYDSKKNSWEGFRAWLLEGSSDFCVFRVSEKIPAGTSRRCFRRISGLMLCQLPGIKIGRMPERISVRTRRSIFDKNLWDFAETLA